MTQLQPIEPFNALNDWVMKYPVIDYYDSIVSRNPWCSEYLIRFMMVGGLT